MDNNENLETAIDMAVVLKTIINDFNSAFYRYNDNSLIKNTEFLNSLVFEISVYIKTRFGHIDEIISVPECIKFRVFEAIIFVHKIAAQEKILLNPCNIPEITKWENLSEQIISKTANLRISSKILSDQVCGNRTNLEWLENSLMQILTQLYDIWLILFSEKPERFIYNMYKALLSNSTNNSEKDALK